MANAKLLYQSMENNVSRYELMAFVIRDSLWTRYNISAFLRYPYSSLRGKL